MEKELELTTKKDGSQMEVFLKGEITTNTAPELKVLLDNELEYKVQ